MGDDAHCCTSKLMSSACRDSPTALAALLARRHEQDQDIALDRITHGLWLPGLESEGQVITGDVVGFTGGF